MNVAVRNHDDVSALLTVILEKADYKDEVEKKLTDYAKNMQIPGFRKGKVPLSMVRKQYEAGIAFEEINKKVSEALNNYVKENKLKLVGQPIPQPVNEFDHNAEQLSIAFEIGFEQDFTIDLSKYEAPHYRIEVSDKEIDLSVENMRKRFAEKTEEDEIGIDSYVSLEISQVVEANTEGEHHHHPKNIDISKEQKEAYNLVKNLKKDESVNIFKEGIQSNEELAKQLGFSKEEAEHLHHNELKISVKNIYKLKLAELDEELFDNVYGKGNIKSEEGLRARIRVELGEYFQQNADIHLVNTILRQINEKQEIKLPEDFLEKWLMYSNKEITSEEQAKEILNNEREIIKRQIIEDKLLTENNIKIDYDEILTRAEYLVINQLSIYGIHDMPKQEIHKYAVEMLKDENQLRQISSEISMSKLKDVILKKAKKKETKISHDEFLEELNK